MAMAILTVSWLGEEQPSFAGDHKTMRWRWKYVNWAIADLFRRDRSGVCHLDEMMECERGFRYSSSPHQPPEHGLEGFEQCTNSPACIMGKRDDDQIDLASTNADSSLIVINSWPTLEEGTHL